MRKILKYVRSFCIIVFYKVLFGKRLKTEFFPSLEGKLSMNISNSGNITIGKKLMTRGPVYLRSGDEGKIVIGDNVFFNHNCSVTAMKEIKIGNFCMFGNNLVIVDHDHQNTDVAGNDYVCEKVEIGDHVWVGSNVTILRGVKIGSGSIIGAGCVVNRDVFENEVWCGVPAKKIKSRK